MLLFQRFHLLAFVFALFSAAQQSRFNIAEILQRETRHGSFKVSSPNYLSLRGNFSPQVMQWGWKFAETSENLPWSVNSHEKLSSRHVVGAICGLWFSSCFSSHLHRKSIHQRHARCSEGVKGCRNLVSRITTYTSREWTSILKNRDSVWTLRSQSLSFYWRKIHLHNTTICKQQR